MVKKNIVMSPDYKQIYTDIIEEQYPDKKNDLLIKNKIERISTVIDVIAINQLIFGDQHFLMGCDNQKLKSYDKNSMIKILDYQKRNKLSNTKVADHFKMSRNTISKWKKIIEK